MAGGTLQNPEFEQSAGLWLVVVVAILCAAGNLFEVLAPGQYALQPNLPVFLAAAIVLPPWAIAIVAAASFAPALLQRRQPWFTNGFNVANYLLAGVAAHAVSRLAGDWDGPLDAMTAAALAGGAAVFVAINHVLISVASSLSQGRTAARALVDAVRLRETSAGAPLDIGLALTGACLAGLWAATPSAVLLGLGPILLVHASLWVPALRHRSRIDPKTGLLNFEHLRRSLDSMIETARRDDTQLSVVMLDLDHLRLVNNRHGHLMGDELIVAVAKVLSDCVTDRGVAGRFGGEEFCLVLPGATAEQATQVAEEARKAVAALEVLPADSRLLHPSISAGVATFPEHALDGKGLMSAADTALYDAKLGGRNRVRTVVLDGAGELRTHATPGTDPAAVAAAPAFVASLADAQSADHPESARIRPEAPSSNGTAAAAASVTDAGADPAEPAEPGRAPTAADAEPPSGRRLIPWYAAMLVALTGVVGLSATTAQVTDMPLLFGALVLSVLVLDALRLDLFERLQTSPAALPILALAALFGPLGPIAGEAAIAVTRAIRKTPLVGYAFDFGALALAGAAAAAVFDAIPGAHGSELIAVGVLAGLVYYVVNMPLVAVVISLSKGRSPLANFREQLAWLLPHYGAFGLLGGLFVLVWEEAGWVVFLFFGMPTAVLWVAEQQYLRRSRTGVAELRRRHAELATANERLRRLLDDNTALLRRLQESYLSTITSLARTIEAKDPYTGGHTERVAEIAAALAVDLGFEGDDLRAVEVGAIIHDIGKIGVKDATLLKPGKLTDEEFAEIQRHPEISSYILADLDFPPIVKQMCRNHHERFDGEGYPDGLAGEEIPLAARLLTVADAVDAMTSDRPYRKALPLEDAIQVVLAGAGTQFCPRVVESLQRCLAAGTVAIAPPAHTEGTDAAAPAASATSAAA